ncbi:MAG: hypothetical protein JWP99_84 [Devosia sp.]|nr:hypothetical protein [Devosia sp.]
MKLPPVDVYRKAFIEPIGHLAMQAAYTDGRLIELCASIPEPMEVSGVAGKLRNWDEKAKELVRQRFQLIPDSAERCLAFSCAQTFGMLRLRRNRVLHDAIGVAIYDEESGYRIGALQVQYPAQKEAVKKRQLSPVRPEDIAALACEFYELHRNLEDLCAAVSNRAG